MSVVSLLLGKPIVGIPSTAGIPPAAPSPVLCGTRGSLPLAFVESSASAIEFMRSLSAARPALPGFNLLVGQSNMGGEWAYTSNNPRVNWAVRTDMVSAAFYSSPFSFLCMHSTLA